MTSVTGLTPLPSHTSAFVAYKPTYASRLTSNAPPVVPYKAPAKSSRIKKKPVLNDVPVKSSRIKKKPPGTSSRIKKKPFVNKAPGTTYSTVPNKDTSRVTTTAVNNNNSNEIVYKAKAVVYEDTNKKPNAKKSLGRGGGNTVTKYYSGTVVKVDIQDGVRMWQPERPSYLQVIQALVEVIKKLPPTSVTTDTLLHPLVKVSGFILNKEEYNATASLAYPKEGATLEKKKKSLGKVLCYMGLRSTYQPSTGTHVILFDLPSWNNNGYRLIKDTGGVPTIVDRPI